MLKRFVFALTLIPSLAFAQGGAVVESAGDVQRGGREVGRQLGVDERLCGDGHG